MAIILSGLSPAVCEYMALVDALLAKPWDRTAAACHGVDFEPMRLHILIADDNLVEAEVTLPDAEDAFLAALTWHFGEPIVLHNTYARAYRWPVGGHEVLMEVRQGREPTLLVA